LSEFLSSLPSKRKKRTELQKNCGRLKETNQRSKRFDRLGHALATDILPDSQSHYLKLCERTLSFAVSLREEGEVAWLESPNGLGATARVSNARRSVNN